MILDLLARGFRFILLQRDSKDPLSRHGHHWVTTDAQEIRQHRGNVGLLAGTHAVLDFDRVSAFDEMSVALGALRPTVATGSGKRHCYIQPVPELPRQFFWRGQKVGEIARLPSEYMVAPPSIHPDTKRPYRWLVDPRAPFPTLPEAWQRHLVTPLASSSRPNFIAPGDTTGVDLTPDWDGPPAEELLQRALKQPGARARAFGVKFQCPGCRAEGHDKHQDNALVRLDGRWGCALTPSHRRAIAEALGVIGGPDIPDEYDPAVLRRLGAFRL